MSKWKWGRIFLVIVTLNIISSIASMYMTTKVYADTTGWTDVAMDSKDTKQITDNLKKAKSGMEKWKATSGNAYLFFGTPSSDMGETVKNLDSYIARVETLDKLDKSSKEYQDGLTDINDSLSYFYLNADEYWLRHQGLGLLIVTWVLGFLSWISFASILLFYFVNKKDTASVGKKMIK